MKVLDLFSGGGGFSIGLSTAGFDVYGYEWKDDIVDHAKGNGLNTVKANVFSDNFVATTPDDIFMIVGGPPCQPFSQGNKRGRGADDERNGIDAFLNIVEKKQPLYFIMEEAPTLTWKKHRDYLEQIRLKIKTMGYHHVLKVCDMSYFCVPQKRKRTIVVGSKFPLDLDFLKDETMSHLPISAVLSKQEIEAVHILPEGEIVNRNFNNTVQNGENKISRYSKKVAERVYYNYEWTEKQKLNARILKFNQPSLTLSITSLKATSVAAMPNNASRFAFRTDGEKKDLLLFLDNRKKECLNPDVIQRPLTVHEMRRIQTFPDTYCFKSRKMAETIIGNSVPPMFARILAKRVLDHYHSCSI